MVELKVYLSESVNERFRRLAMSVYGYGRGSLSRAAEEAFARWCTDHEEHRRHATPGGASDDWKKPVEHARSGVNPDERQSDTVGSKASGGQNSSAPKAQGD